MPKHSLGIILTATLDRRLLQQLERIHKEMQEAEIRLAEVHKKLDTTQTELSNTQRERWSAELHIACLCNPNNAEEQALTESTCHI